MIRAVRYGGRVLANNQLVYRINASFERRWTEGRYTRRTKRVKGRREKQGGLTLETKIKSWAE